MSSQVVRRETNVVAFARRVMPFLLQREAQHNVMIGLFAVLQVRPPEIAPYLAWAERGGEIVGVAMRTPPFKLLLSHGMDSDVIEALAQDLHSDTPQLPGVLSATAEAAEFSAYWTSLTGQTAAAGLSERLYRLTQVKSVPLVDGRMRAVTDADLELVTDWWLAFSEESVETISRQQAAQAISNRYGVDPLVGGLRLWEADNSPVSLAGYTGPTPNSIRIGPVYTPPEQRGHGYATAVVAGLSQELLDKGFAFVTLYTDLANPTSNHIYQDIGYLPVADIDEIHFAPVA